MKYYTLGIGDLAVSKENDVTYTCLGLGSCVGLFLLDRSTGITGGAHIMLPTGGTSMDMDKKFYTVQCALQELLLQFRTLGSTLQNLRAKVVGGANVVATGFEVGAQNTSALLDQLVQQRIYIAAKDLGGYQGRTARFDAQTGTMTVRLAQTNELKIY